MTSSENKSRARSVKAIMTLCIKKISRIREYGIFSDGSINACSPSFARYNLVYGFNGSGKSTLSTLIDGLKQSRYTERTGAWSIELQDGTKIDNYSKNAIPDNQIMVFNERFISENLQWSKNTLNPVFYIGQDAARKGEFIDRLQMARSRRADKLQEEQNRYEKASTEFANFQRNTARMVAESLNLGRQYNASNLRVDFSHGPLRPRYALSKKDRQTLRKAATQDAPYEHIPKIDLDELNLQNSLCSIIECLSKTVGKITIQDLQNHPSMLDWVKEGHNYHKQENLEDCLFCGNKITAARFNELEKLINSGLEEFFGWIDDAISDGQRLRDQLETFKRKLPNERQISASQFEEFQKHLSETIQLIRGLLRFVDATVGMLRKKRRNPTLNLIRVLHHHQYWVEITCDAVRTSATQLNRLIGQHNTEQENFEKYRRDCAEKLKYAILADFEKEYQQHKNEMDAAARKSEELQMLVEACDRRIGNARQQIEDHRPAIHKINMILQKYLGHTEIELESEGQAYKIKRRGQLLEGHLSEGERTALALSYFISKLGERQRDINEQVVVVDDPVSSLDAGAIHFASNVIKNNFANVAQLVVLTHNLTFMIEMKRWMQSRDMKEQSALMYLQAEQKGVEQHRVAVLRKMPKLLRGHDSEYGYLFYLVRACAQDGIESEAVPGYLMPNVIRRVLELFLAFKKPGSEGFSDKVHEAAEDTKLDDAEVATLERVVQSESHSSAVEQIQGFSSVTLEQSERAARSALSLVREMDSQHFDGMERLCRKKQF